MSLLLETQQAYARCLADFLTYIYSQKHSATLGEAYRTDEQALIHALGAEGRLRLAQYLEMTLGGEWHGLALAVANNGKATGILLSLHRDRLAVDLNIFSPDGRLLETVDDLRPLGEYWETLDPRARWGGRFKDADHFSFEWGGRR